MEPTATIGYSTEAFSDSLLELYGLVSIVDDFAFGDLKSYRTRFARLGNHTDFTELKERLKPLCKRTLHRQVLEYVKYTNRHALVQEFVPPEAEQRLYDLVSDYLHQPTLYALSASQRQLMTLILRKLLASSTYAISGALEGLVYRLEAAVAAATAVDTPPEEIPVNWEALDELADEWEGDTDDAAQPERARLTTEQLAGLRQEMAQLRQFHALAKSILKNSKGEVLLIALRRGFAAAAQAQQSQGAATLQQKAVIFTSPAAHRNTCSVCSRRPSSPVRSCCSTARTTIRPPRLSISAGVGAARRYGPHH
jgi:hypothetical protein